MPVSPDINLKYNSKGKFCKENNFSFAKNTTYGCGGDARIAFFPDNLISAKKAYDIVSRYKHLILGNGSNVLASDSFYDGAVISTKRLSGIYRVRKNILCCLAGTKIPLLLNYCVRNCLGGLEYLNGIPATLGGASYMNAGIRERYIGSDILKVRLYDGKQFDLINNECDFSYKHSTMRDINAIILAVFIKVKPNCNKGEIIENLLYYKDLRKNLPKGKSCGCVFKNIGAISAGKIIQDCGLANFNIGNARVSEKHCNFILNEGASSFDIKNLINFVKTKVYEKTSLKLEEEVIYIGDFYDSYS